MTLTPSLIELLTALAPWATILVVILALILQNELRRVLLGFFDRKTRDQRGEEKYLDC